MSIESLMRAILVLHHGNGAQYAMLNCSVAKQIEKTPIRPIVIDGKTVDAMEMIIAAKYTPFEIAENKAHRTVQALTINMTTEDDVKLVLQTSHTECPVDNDTIVYEQEQVVDQTNNTIEIAEYSKICNEFELYFEED